MTERYSNIVKELRQVESDYFEVIRFIQSAQSAVRVASIGGGDSAVETAMQTLELIIERNKIITLRLEEVQRHL